MKKSNQKDLTNSSFGNLLILGRSKIESNMNSAVWSCKCICGTIVDLSTSLLVGGYRKSCGKKECRVLSSTLTKDKRNRPILSERVLKQKRLKYNRIPISEWRDPDKGILLLEYINGLSIAEIAEGYSVTPDSLDPWIKKQRDKFNTIHELRLLNSLEKMPLIQKSVELALRTRFTSEELLKQLSPEDSTTLSPSEMVYGWIYFNTGNNDTALKESGLLDCLADINQSTKSLLGMYLREKSNIVQYLKQLQANQLGETFVDKSVIQQELINQIKQLREIISVDGGSGNSRTQLLKCVELLGKTIGAFTENVNVTEVKASDAIDRLIDLAKHEYQVIDNNQLLIGPTGK